ncbi:MAG TPA: hypothetical protein VFG23_05730 [Polyangia bacterium]|nr:hypothetical protein [Polyangia bacterium]
MRRRAGNHGFSAAAKSLVVAVMAAATLAQFFALSHEVTVRHFRCAEHGELTHVARLAIDLPTLGARRSVDAWQTQVAETADAHEHCATAFTVVGGSAPPVVRVAVRFTPPPSVYRAEPVAAPPIARAFFLASAPKTSPPSA